MSGMSKRIRETLKAVKAVRPGKWRWSITRGEHLRLVHVESGTVLTVASTPSDVRAVKNLVADVERQVPE